MGSATSRPAREAIRSRRRTVLALMVLAVLVAVLFFLSLRLGWKWTFSPAEIMRGVGAELGLAAPLEGASRQVILGLRLHRAWTALAVGASLALSGSLLQGLFRNGLASPSVIGVTAGSVLGASFAIALVGGYGAGLVPLSTGFVTPALVSGAALVGALGTTWLVLSLASRGGRVSVPTLLLGGIALNTVVGGLLATLQSVTLRDFEVSRAILAWTFGTLDDRTPWQVTLAWGGLLLGLAVVPFVARELDLFATGEEDAAGLGVSVARVKWLVLLGATMPTACAVSVSGQIPFIGLVVPHIVRAVVGREHRRLLPVSALAGAAFLLGADLLNARLLRDLQLQPGVLMSLIGGPFFLVLLVRQRRRGMGW